ncbi:MAG: cadherin-like beta sandwich domain-containing protein [Bacilli bacterium]|jgi:hypothetical protein|nr:cadherin-like beta sandwich domain-containing protein [Bacilli bacterium]
MKKNILKIGVMLISLFIGLTKANAASFNISASTTNPTKGSTVTLTIRGNDVTGRFNISSSNSGVVAVSEDRAWIENNTYSIKLSAINTGSATITVTPSGVSDGSGNPANLKAKSIKINVTAPREKSNDNNLKSLNVTGFELSPEFDKDVQVYLATVPEGTKNIEIKATANSPYATVTGAGNIELEEGSNAINIVVKSETGIEKIYTINIDVKDENPIEVTVNDRNYTVVKLKEHLTKPDTFEESTITIEGYEIPVFINDKADITLVGLKNEDGVIKLFEYKDGKYSKFNEMNLNHILLIPVPLDKELDFNKGKVNINGEEIDCYKINDNSEFVIINAKSLSDGNTSYYLYDTENNTVIRYDEELISASKETLKLYSYVIIAFASTSFLMLIIIICLLHSSKKKQKKINKFIERQEAKIEATRKLNDVVSEVQKITAKEKEDNKGELEKKAKINLEETKKIAKVEEEKKSEYDKADLTGILDTLSKEKLEATQKLEIDKNELSKKELKELKKLEKKKAKEKKKNKNQDEEINIKKINVNNRDVTDNISDDTEEVYDLFGDD